MMYVGEPTKNGKKKQIYHGVGSRMSGLNRSLAIRTVLHGPPVLEILLAETALAPLGSLYEGPARPRGSWVSVVNVPQGWAFFGDEKTLKWAYE